MMYSLVPVAVIAVYIGNVLGNLVLCETIPELRKAKKSAWKIPIISFFFVLYCLFSFDRKDPGNFLYVYLKMPCKNLLVSCAVADVERKAAAQKKKSIGHQSSKQNEWRSFKASVEGYGRAILGNCYFI